MRYQYILPLAFMVLISLGVLYTPVGQAAGPATRYVATVGTNTGGCTSSTLPCRTIQYAVNQSISGDTIKVTQGIYTYDTIDDICTFLLTRAVVCFVDKQLTILGGYSISGWSTADPNTNLTIIDGQNFYRGVAVIGYNTTNTHLEMNGITIQNGLAQGPTYLNPYDPSGVGGGMLVQHASTTLRDVNFKNNQARGQNTSSGYGGQADGAAIRIESAPVGTTSLLQQVIFDNNQSYGGTGPDRGGIAFGALFVFKSTVIVEDSTFKNNLAMAGNSSGAGLGGGLYADALGGGIAVEQGNITLRRITVTGNKIRGGDAVQHGGGAYGGGIFIEDFGENATTVTINDSYVANNIAIAGNAQQGGNAAGGGIDTADNNVVVIERTQIISNSAIGGSSSSGNAGPGAGGGLYIFAERSGTFNASLKNVIIAENFADQGTGNTSLGNGGGGGIVIHGMNADITHATIAANRLGSGLILGQGLLVQPWPSPSNPSFPANVNLNYSIVANHTEGGSLATAVIVQQGSSLTFNRGIWAGNIKDSNTDNSPVASGSVNGLGSMLNSTSVNFVSSGLPNQNYHLASISLAINQAISSATTDDIDGQVRPFDGVADIGADEYIPPSLIVNPSSAVLLVTGSNRNSTNVLVDALDTTMNVTWTAVTTAPWLSFASSGIQTISGRKGDQLYLWGDPTGLALGTYETDVSISSPNAKAVTLHVKMVNAAQIFSIYLPVVIFQ